MYEHGFSYVLNTREFSFWHHEVPSIRSWYRGEIRARAKQLAHQAGTPAWAIFAPDETALESVATGAEEDPWEI